METSQELALIPIWCDTKRGPCRGREKRRGGGSECAVRWRSGRPLLCGRSTVADRKGKKGVLFFLLGAVDRWTRGGRPLAAAEGLVQRRKDLSSRRQGPNELKVAWCGGGAVRKLNGLRRLREKWGGGASHSWASHPSWPLTKNYEASRFKSISPFFGSASHQEFQKNNL